jgi:hypothetical protein
MADAVVLTPPSPAAVPVRRRPRLADLPWQPLAALVPLIPPSRPALVLRPICDGLVMAEAGGGACCAVLELAGELSRELYLPRAGLTTLARRHPHAERLTVDGPAPDGAELLLLRAIDDTSSATVICLEADALAGSVASLLAAVPVLALGDGQQALIDPQLLTRAITVMGRISGGGPVDLSVANHDTLGLLVKCRPAPDSDLIRAAIAIARMIESADG